MYVCMYEEKGIYSSKEPKRHHGRAGVKKTSSTKLIKKSPPIVNNQKKAITTKDLGTICAPPRGCNAEQKPKKNQEKQTYLQTSYYSFSPEKDLYFIRNFKLLVYEAQHRYECEIWIH